MPDIYLDDDPANDSEQVCIVEKSPIGGGLMKFKWQIVGLVLMFSGLFGASSPIWAQTAERSAPSPTYFMIFREFYAGDYKNALDAFQAEARGCIKAGQSRWIDSICYETMIGECFYQMGVLDKALEHYNLALELAAVFPDWMIRVQFPQIRGGRHAQAVSLGASTRRSALGYFPSSMLISQGQINNSAEYYSKAA